MATLAIGDDNFREFYQNNDIVILDFWANWCGPCLRFAPIYDLVSDRYPNIIFGKVDTELEQKLSMYFEIRSIPTIVIIREELEVFRHTGFLGEEALVETIEQVKSADMEKIRSQIEPEESE